MEPADTTIGARNQDLSKLAGNTRPKGGLMEIGAIPNGRDKRDETGIDSDAMVSVSGIKQDFCKQYTIPLF